MTGEMLANHEVKQTGDIQLGELKVPEVFRNLIQLLHLDNGVHTTTKLDTIPQDELQHYTTPVGITFSLPETQSPKTSLAH